MNVPTVVMNFVDEAAPQQTYFGFRIVVDPSTPDRLALVVYPNHPLSYRGRENGQTEIHMNAETNELVQQSPNRKDVQMRLAPAAAA